VGGNEIRRPALVSAGSNVENSFSTKFNYISEQPFGKKTENSQIAENSKKTENSRKAQKN